MVRLTFQARDYSREQPDEIGIDVAGFDLDYGAVTVYVNEVDGINHTLAVPDVIVAELGAVCSGFRIDPEPALLDAFPLLYKLRGFKFARVIVTSGGFAVDETPADVTLIGEVAR